MMNYIVGGIGKVSTDIGINNYDAFRCYFVPAQFVIFIVVVTSNVGSDFISVEKSQ
jgi:hypothetical protein